MSEFKAFQAVVANVDTKETYIMFVEAEGNNFAEKEIYEVFDNLFYHEDTKEQDMYTFTVQEIEAFPKLPEDTTWTTSVFGRKHAIFKKIN